MSDYKADVTRVLQCMEEVVGLSEDAVTIAVETSQQLTTLLNISDETVALLHTFARLALTSPTLSDEDRTAAEYITQHAPLLGNLRDFAAVQASKLRSLRTRTATVVEQLAHEAARFEAL